MRVLYDIGITIAGAGALVRVGAVVVGAIRSVRARRRFREYKVGWIELVTWIEPPLLAALSVLLLFNPVRAPSTLQAVLALVGGVIVAYGVNVLMWAVLSWRQLFVGHGVLEGQQLMSEGAYGFVRHPSYLACLLVWTGLSVAFLNPIVAAVTAFYVLPIYLAYLRAEERMMKAHFGEAYDHYCAAVPMLIPRIGGGRHHPAAL
jgi:protein-S-isoprenylcysteine O-methyltransferase Ste14